MVHFSEEELELPEDVGQHARFLLEAGMKNGWQMSSASRAAVYAKEGNRLTARKFDKQVEFLEKHSEGAARRSLDPLLLPNTAISCGICHQAIMERMDMGQKVDSLLSPWFFSFAAYREHVEQHSPSEWGATGEDMEMWQYLWQLASGEKTPAGFGSQRKKNQQMERLPDELVKKVPTKKLEEAESIHYCHMRPLIYPSVTIRVCQDQKTEEILSMRAIGFLLATCWQKWSEKGRYEKLKKQQKIGSWVKTKVFGSKMMSPAFFPPGVVGTRSGDWLHPVIDAVFKSLNKEVWEKSNIRERRRVLHTLQEGWAEQWTRLHPKGEHCFDERCENEGHEHHPDMPPQLVPALQAALKEHTDQMQLGKHPIQQEDVEPDGELVREREESAAPGVEGTEPLNTEQPAVVEEELSETDETGAKEIVPPQAAVQGVVEEGAPPVNNEGNRSEMRVLTSTKQGKGRKNSNSGARNAGAGSSSSKSSKDVAKLAVLSAKLGSSVVISPAAVGGTEQGQGGSGERPGQAGGGAPAVDPAVISALGLTPVGPGGDASSPACSTELVPVGGAKRVRTADEVGAGGKGRESQSKRKRHSDRIARQQNKE